MTTLAHRSALRRAEERRRRRPPRGRSAGRGACSAASGGSSSWCLTLLTVAVAAAIGSITIAYNAVPADNSEFGSANQLLTFDGSDPRKLQAGLDAAEEVVRDDRRRSATAPCPSPAASRRWTTGRRTPGGAYGGELLALRRGSYPAGPGEVAVTDGVAELSAARDRVDPGARRATTDRRGHRREPEQAERRVRSRLPLVREPGPRHRARRRERRSRSTPSIGPR